MHNRPNKSYIICSTPRIGSTYLCSLLKSTKVAGVPESYFRKQDLNMWAEKWGIFKEDEQFSISDFVDNAIINGRTDNNVFAMRVMWGTMEEIVSSLRDIKNTKDGSDKDVIEHFFGKTDYIYLQRSDKVAQAISLFRALKTDTWHIENKDETAKEISVNAYNFEEIHKLVLEAEEHNTSWELWFKNNNISPFRIIYEELDLDPLKTIKNLIQFLDLTLPSNTVIESKNKKISDDINKEWITRYRADRENA